MNLGVDPSRAFCLLKAPSSMFKIKQYAKQAFKHNKYDLCYTKLLVGYDICGRGQAFQFCLYLPCLNTHLA